MRRFIAWLTVLAIMLPIAGVLPFGVSAGEAGTFGDGFSWEYQQDTKTLTVSGTGAISENPWSEWNGEIRHVVVTEGVTEIGVGVFRDCASLQRVELPASLRTIGAMGFDGCEGLSELELPEGVVTIEFSAFGDCKSLKQVEMPDSVSTIGPSAFFGCSSLEEINLKNTVKSVGDYAFADCTSLKRVTLPASVWSESLFLGCTSLCDVVFRAGIDVVDTRMFNGCKALEQIAIPGGASEIRTQAFADCVSLAEVLLPGSVKTIGERAFSACGKLERIAISEGTVAIQEYAFEQCGALKELYIPNSVETISDTAFDGCEQITICGHDGSYAQSFADRHGIPFIVAEEYPSGVCGEGVTWSFHPYTGTLSITGTGAMEDYSFNKSTPWAEYLTEIRRGELAPGVTSVGAHAFSGCTALEVVDIPNSVTKIGTFAFYQCAELASVMLSENVDQIGGSMFRGCTSLTALGVAEGNQVFSSWNDMLYVYDALSDCAPGKSGDVVVRDGTEMILDYAFQYNTQLTSITIPASVKTMGKYPIYHCSDSIVIYVEKGSYAQDWAKKQGVPYKVSNCDHPVWRYWVTIVQASCTEPGVEQRICENCYEPQTREIPIREHRYSETARVEASCTREGWVVKTCIYGNCHDIKEEVLPIVDHEYSSEFTMDAEPTCTEVGSKSRHCIDCDAVIEQTEVPALGHDYAQEWTVDIQPTIITAGSKSRHCTRCEERIEQTEVPMLTYELPFTDVPEGKWYRKAVEYAVANELFNGVSATEFAPDRSMNRAMLVSVLYRMEGSPQVTELKNSFSDVPVGKYYTDAVIWASGKEIVNGVGAGKFAPENRITREQLAAILYRYAQQTGYETTSFADLSAFPDGAQVSDYAKEALSWANGTGLITGAGTGEQILLDPKGSATRAQVATILMRFQVQYVGS